LERKENAKRIKRFGTSVIAVEGEGMLYVGVLWMAPPE
jgi:hypothetical protein